MTATHWSAIDSTRTGADNLRVRRTEANAYTRLARDYGAEGQHSSEVQQRPHYLTPPASCRCVPASANNGTNGYCAEFGTKSSTCKIKKLMKLDPSASRRRFLSRTCRVDHRLVHSRNVAASL
jgi:hypothetical protein